jgi:hypothetical protein
MDFKKSFGGLKTNNYLCETNEKNDNNYYNNQL